MATGRIQTSLVGTLPVSSAYQLLTMSFLANGFPDITVYFTARDL
jgi:hypothetical protein